MARIFETNLRGYDLNAHVPGFDRIFRQYGELVPKHPDKCAGIKIGNRFYVMALDLLSGMQRATKFTEDMFEFDRLPIIGSRSLSLERLCREILPIYGGSRRIDKSFEQGLGMAIRELVRIAIIPDRYCDASQRQHFAKWAVCACLLHGAMADDSQYINGLLNIPSVRVLIEDLVMNRQMLFTGRAIRTTEPGGVVSVDYDVDP